MAKKKETQKEKKEPFVAPKFKVEESGKQYEVVIPSFVVPGFGKLTAAEAAKNPEVLAHLVEINSAAIQEVEPDKKGGE